MRPQASLLKSTAAQRLVSGWCIDCMRYVDMSLVMVCMHMGTGRAFWVKSAKIMRIAERTNAAASLIIKEHSCSDACVWMVH